MTLPVLGDWIIFSDTQLHHTWPLQWIILTIQMMNFFKLVYGGLFQTPNDNQCSSFRHVPLKIIVINTPISYTMIISKVSIHSYYHCDWNQCSLQWFFGDQCNLHWFEVWILPTVTFTSVYPFFWWLCVSRDFCHQVFSLFGEFIKRLFETWYRRIQDVDTFQIISKIWGRVIGSFWWWWILVIYTFSFPRWWRKVYKQ